MLYVKQTFFNISIHNTLWKLLMSILLPEHKKTYFDSCFTTFHTFISIILIFHFSNIPNFLSHTKQKSASTIPAAVCKREAYSPI